MDKKRLWIFGVAAAAIVVALLIGGGHRPFRSINADEIAVIDITARPPDVTRKITDPAGIADIMNTIQNVVIYEKSEEWRDYAGQVMEFTVVLRSGGQMTIVAYNPFLIIDGQGYRTKYGPCEELNRLGNALTNEYSDPAH